MVLIRNHEHDCLSHTCNDENRTRNLATHHHVGILNHLLLVRITKIGYQPTTTCMPNMCCLYNHMSTAQTWNGFPKIATHCGRPGFSSIHANCSAIPFCFSVGPLAVRRGLPIDIATESQSTDNHNLFVNWLRSAAAMPTLPLSKIVYC